MTKNFIFDLDGTLIDSKKEIITTYRNVIQQVSPKKIIDSNNLDFGANLLQNLTIIYGEDESKIKQAKKLFIELYDQSDYVDTNLYPDVLETLIFLKEKKNNIFIATNKRFAPTIKILKAKNILHLFTDVFANEMIPNKIITKIQMIAEIKNKYQLKNTDFMIGDTNGDIDSGNINNLITIAVTYGYQNKKTLEISKPTYLIDSFKKMNSFV